MPSVIAYWTGQLRDPAEREELCLRLADLGRLSHRFFQGKPPDIKRFDHRIEGDILLSAHLFSSPPSTRKFTQVTESLYSVGSLSLIGFEFRLFDGRDLYPGNDRITVVFCVDDDPEFDGLMVYVEERDECRKYEDERIQQADFYLAVPHIHLRYYLEKWMDDLMGWIKYHYVENPVYWRGEWIWTDRVVLNGHFSQFGKYEFFETLKQRFESEVAAWQKISEEAKRFWGPLRAQSDEDED